MSHENRIDWSLHGCEIVALYVSGMSTREIVVALRERYGVEYKSGTLTNFLGRRGVLRSRAEAHKIKKRSLTRTCVACRKKFNPVNYNQRYCTDCSGVAHYGKRLMRYGLTAQELTRMLVEQNNRCKLCGAFFEDGFSSNRKRTLYVDHDHVTGDVRGLLCPRCNLGMSFIDKREWLERAIEYSARCGKIAQDPTTIVSLGATDESTNSEEKHQ